MITRYIKGQYVLNVEYELCGENEKDVAAAIKFLTAEGWTPDQCYGEDGLIDFTIRPEDLPEGVRVTIIEILPSGWKKTKTD